MSELAIGPDELDNLLNSVDEMASDIANIDEHLRTQAAPRNAEAEATKHRADSNLTARPVQFAPLKTPSSTIFYKIFYRNNCSLHFVKLIKIGF
jgi:hypothetical protein